MQIHLATESGVSWVSYLLKHPNDAKIITIFPFPNILLKIICFLNKIQLAGDTILIYYKKCK